MAGKGEQPSGGIDAVLLIDAVKGGDSDRVKHIIDSIGPEGVINVKDKHGNTALHIAVRRNYVHIITQLIKIQRNLCDCTNNEGETPIGIAAKLGHLEAVEALIKSSLEAVKEPDNCGMNVLHLAALVSQVRIVDYLNKTVPDALSELVNQALKKPSKIETLERGDTPLHIAARNKNSHMVISLLNIRGIDKEASNEAGLTALDIAREITEYHESYQIIGLLAKYPSKKKPFLHSAPKVSLAKYKNAINMVNETYDKRRDKELVVAVLLATMSFTAVFTIPGGFKTDLKTGETEKMLGLPILIGIKSFKLFIILDCLAFFLSLFAVLMWQMSTPLTTGDKVLFLVINNLLVCASFAFTACGFMAAVYTMLAHKHQKLAWFMFWASIIVCCSGSLAFFYLAARFSVKLARFNCLRGVHPFLRDRVLECVWRKLESLGVLDCVRWCKRKRLDLLYGYSRRKAGAMPITEYAGSASCKAGSQSTVLCMGSIITINNFNKQSI